MATLSEIQEVARKVVEMFDAQKVILIGSHARGTQRSDSDVDLVVIMPFEGTTYSQAVRIAQAVKPAFWVDFLVRRPEDALERYRLGDPIMREAFDHGRVLHERAA